MKKYYLSPVSDIVDAELTDILTASLQLLSGDANDIVDDMQCDYNDLFL